jgi:hypothetical protein
MRRCDYHRRTMVGLARLLAVALLVAACSTTSPPASPPATTTTGLASVGPSATQESPAPPKSLAPLAGAKIYLQDPAVEITLPEGWRHVSVDEIKTEFESQAPSADSATEARASFEEKLSSGRLRMGAMGFTPSGVMVGFGVVVEDIASTAELIGSLAEDTELSSEVDTVETGTVDSPIGRATWVRFALHLPPEQADTYVPSHVLAYLVPTDDGQTLILDSVGPQDDPTHQGLMDQIIRTIRRPSSSPVPAMPSARVGTTNPATPAIGFEYPDRFVLWPIKSYGTALKKQLALDESDSTRQAIEDLDDGITRLVLVQRPFTNLEFTGLIIGYVEDSPRGLDATVDRWLSRLPDPATRGTRDLARLSIGTGIRVETPGGASTPGLVNIMYVVQLKDGQTLTISGSAQDSDGTFADVMERFAESLTATWTRST